MLHEQDESEVRGDEAESDDDVDGKARTKRGTETIITIQNRATLGRAPALCLMLATLIAMLLSAAPAGAAVPSGKAFSWGGNDYGQLGTNTSGASTDTPGAVSNLGGVKSVKAGCDHSLALKTVGTVYSWGDNFFGQLGNGTFTPTDTPGPVSNLSGVKAIATDSYAQHALALLNNGTVRSFAYYSS